MKALAILVAAGRGERLGADRPKAFVPLAGQPMLLHSARAFDAAPSVDGVVVVVPADRIGAAREMLAGVRRSCARPRSTTPRCRWWVWWTP